ncbi:MAG: hypothetical protein HY459_02790 [Parcubacteria group bacterium]|nr:hypothetical protein [Parcubacteria group bacterium]
MSSSILKGFVRRVGISFVSLTTVLWSVGPLVHVARAATFMFPNGVLIQQTGSADVWEVDGGHVRRIPNPTILAAIQRGRPILSATADEVALLQPAGVEMGYPVGTFVKRPNDPKIYITDFVNDIHFIRHITSNELYNQYGGQTKGFVETSVASFYTEGASVVPGIYPNGLLVKGTSSSNVYVLDNGQKRMVPNAGLLTAIRDNRAVVTLADATITSFATGNTMGYQTGTFIQNTGGASPDLFVIDGAGRRYVPDMTTLTRIGGSAPKITQTDIQSYALGSQVEPSTGGTTPPPDTGTGLSVALSASTPAASVVAPGSNDVVLTKVDFTSGSGASHTITSVTVTRGGVSADTDVSNVKLWDGATQIGSTQALNTTTHKATFAGISVAVPAGTAKTLSFSITVAAAAAAGNLVVIGISAASEVVTDVTPTGTFPVNGNGRSIATTAVGRLDVSALTTPADANILSGSTDQTIGTFRFAPTATEGFDVTSITLSEIGTSVDSDISNIKLKVGATQVGSTASALTNGKVTFNLSATPINVLASGTKDVSVYVDITSGITSSRTVRFEINKAADVTAVGSNSGGAVTITVSGTPSTYTAAQSQTMTITQGSLTTALDTAANPAAQNYVKGSNDRSFTSLKFSAGSTEGVRITELTLTLAGTSAAATDISNVSLWDGTTQVGTTGQVVGTTVKFGNNTSNVFDSSGLFDIAASANKVITVKASIPTGADATHTVSLSVNAAGDVKADGLTSQNDIPAASVTGTATGNAHAVTAKGTLTVSLGSTTPAAATFSTGTTGNTISRFDLTANSGENITVSSVVIRMYEASGTGNATDSGDVTNVKLWDGTTQLGSTVASPSATATFATNLTVAAGTAKILTVTADIPTTSNSTALHFDLLWASNTTDISATGASSGASITAAGDATGNTHTVSTGTLTVIAGPTPVYTNITTNSVDVALATIVFTAGTAENVRISQIRVKEIGTVADTAVTNVKLFDGTTQVGSTVGSLTSSQANFTGLAVDVTKGQQKTVTVKATVTSTAADATYVHFGVDDYDSDISATGLSSNSSIVANKKTTINEGATFTASDTTLTVTSGSAIGAGDLITLDNEDLLVTAVSTNDLTVVRSFGNTTAATHADGANVVLKVDASANGGIAASANLVTANTNTTLTFTSSVIGTIAIGQAVVFFDNAVAASADDGKLVTATDTNTNGTHIDLTLVDQYFGAAYTEAAPDNSGDFEVTYTNYGRAFLINTNGTLTVAVDTDTPVAAQTVAGTAGVSFSKVKLSATKENVNVESIKFTMTGTAGKFRDSDFSSVSLWNGTTQVGTNQVVSAATITFDITANPLSVPKDGNVILTLKGDINTIANGAVSADDPKFYIGDNQVDIVSKGASTNTAIPETDGATNPETAGNFNSQTIYKTKLTMALNVAQPNSGFSEGLSREVVRIDATNSANAVNQDATLTTLSLLWSRTNATVDVVKLFRADTNAQLSATVNAPGLTSATAKVTGTNAASRTNFASIAYVIPAGTTKTIYVQASLHFQGSGTLAGAVQATVDSFGSASTAGDVTWGDGDTTAITWVNVAGATGLQNTTNMTYSSGTDTYAPRMVFADGTDAGTAGLFNNAADILDLAFTEPINSTLPNSTQSDTDFVFAGGATDGAQYDASGATGVGTRVTTFQTNDTFRWTGNGTTNSTNLLTVATHNANVSGSVATLKDVAGNVGTGVGITALTIN